MHWECFVKNKGKLERYKKENRAKKTGEVKHNKMEGADGNGFF